MTDSNSSGRMPCILSIAGSDSGGGAGIQADIKTITMMGAHAMTAITAVTAQNSRGVTRVDALSADAVTAQIEAVSGDFGIDAVKIGMLGSAEIAEAVAASLSSMAVPIVFDPVMVATSGAALADEQTVAAFATLMRMATVTTPNRAELEALGGEDAVLAQDCALLVKGGHDDGDVVTDRLLVPGQGEIARWQAPRIQTPHSHGTGCTLSSAVATALGQGHLLAEAVERARAFVRLALLDAPSIVRTNGPMGHGMVRNDAVLDGPLLNQITVPCADYAASVAFYRALGLRQIVDSPPRYARFKAANGVTLSIHAADEIADAGNEPASATVYLERAGLDRACSALAAQGFAFDHGPTDQDWGWREARLSDPFGNVICLYHAGETRRYPPWRIAEKPGD